MENVEMLSILINVRNLLNKKNKIWNNHKLIVKLFNFGYAKGAMICEELNIDPQGHQIVLYNNKTR